MAIDYYNNIIYGPLKSRRLGKSLGINMVPHKTCSLDCVYCEAGSTTNLTIQRDSYIDINTIKNELELNISKANDIDYITICGTGEPTLHVDIGELIRHIKKKYFQYKLCLITNSTMFTYSNIWKDIVLCDLIMPSLDAVSYDVFQKIDRPHPQIDLSKIIEALTSFRSIYSNLMWLEIFFIEGINDTPAELALLKEVCLKISPDLVQLNSLDRKGIFDWVKKMPANRMLEIKHYFFPLPTIIV